MRPSCTASLALAICTSLRAAASGSVKWLGSTNFIGSQYHERRQREPPEPASIPPEPTPYVNIRSWPSTALDHTFPHGPSRNIQMPKDGHECPALVLVSVPCPGCGTLHF